MDFTLPPEIDALRLKVRAFVAEHVLPLEADQANYDAYENIRLDVLEPLRAKARAAGLWAPQMPIARGGLGLPMVGWCAFYEEANRSIFGPLAFNCAAPDDGNMNVLNKVLKTEAEKDRWLQPIIDGKVRSSFVMTEPHPGLGLGPRRHDADARREARRQIHRTRTEMVHFRRRWRRRTSSSSRAPRTIRAAGSRPFSFTATSPAGASLRRVPTMGPEELGGACELDFDGLEIPEENRLMEEGDGLRLTQIRLGPARLTHCMRWLGLAKRCLEIAHDYVQRAQGLRHHAGRARKRADHAGRQLPPRSPRAGCSPCMRPGRSTRAARRRRKSPWPRSTWPRR